jgi:hypothetical protein
MGRVSGSAKSLRRDGEEAWSWLGELAWRSARGEARILVGLGRGLRRKEEGEKTVESRRGERRRSAGGAAVQSVWISSSFSRDGS